MSVYSAGTAALPWPEADALAGMLLADVRSRVHAAVSGWPMPLPLWLELRRTAAVSLAAGLAPSWPWSNPEAGPVTSDDEVSRARASIEERWG